MRRSCQIFPFFLFSFDEKLGLVSRISFQMRIREEWQRAVGIKILIASMYLVKKFNLPNHLE